MEIGQVIAESDAYKELIEANFGSGGLDVDWETVATATGVTVAVVGGVLSCAFSLGFACNT